MYWLIHAPISVEVFSRKGAQMIWCYPDSKVNGANVGPIWGRQAPGGPHVGPMNLAFWVFLAGGASQLPHNTVILDCRSGWWNETHHHSSLLNGILHDDVIKWKHFPRYWPFVWGTHRSPVDSPHKGQWRGALMFSLICVWINSWINNRDAGDLRRHRAHYDVIVMSAFCSASILASSATVRSSTSVLNNPPTHLAKNT